MGHFLWPNMTSNTDLPPFSRWLARQNPAVDWHNRQNSLLRRLLAQVERLSLLFELPIVRRVGDPRFNPLYHTGTISVLLLVIVFVTGVYLTMFYQFGFVASYEAIARLSHHPFNHWMRGVHRYASGAAVIAALLHGWRTFFQDRFRGARWVAWVTGVVMGVLLWLSGASGYWLLWDERAQAINQSFIRLLDGARWGDAFLLRFLTSEAAGSGWIFLLLVLTLHLLLSIFIGLFYWWHIKRLSRPKWFPPAIFTAAIPILLLGFAALAPVELLPPIHPAQLPASIRVDPLFLAYLPAAIQNTPAAFWGGSLAAVVVLGLLPWMLRRKTLAVAQVDLGRCDGCTLCARDCPYNAITMVPRHDGKRPRFQAEINASLCTSCGICLGSCPEKALTLGEQSIDAWWQTTQKLAETNNVIFACERHLQLNRNASQHLDAQIVPLTCAGMLNPDLIGAILDGGAQNVQIIGCPPEDCTNREGNRWLQERLNRERLPRLRVAYKNAPIQTSWVEPTRFRQAVEKGLPQGAATAYTPTLEIPSWRNFLPAALLLIGVLAAQVATNRLAISPFPAGETLIEIGLRHRSGYPIEGLAEALEPNPSLMLPTRLTLEVDGERVLDQSYPLQGSEHNRRSLAYEQIRIPAGKHHLRLVLFDRPAPTRGQILFDEDVTLAERQALKLSYRDARLSSDPAEGRRLYYETSLGTNAGCRICHSLEPGVVLVGPSFAGVATRAAKRIPGMSAEEYLRQSILDPDAYVVEGFPAGQMITGLGDILTEQQIDDLVAFLMTLEE